MSATGIKAFDTTLQTTHIMLDDLQHTIADCERAMNAGKHSAETL